MKRLLTIPLLVNTLNASDLATALKETKPTGYAKVMYVFDDRKGIKLDQKTFGAGGKIGFETGELGGFKISTGYYATTDFGTRSKIAREIDAFMFDIDKKPYSILGEAALSYSSGAHSFILGRQEIDTPIIQTYDYRIIPNLFEAYTYTNKSLKDTALTLSYVTRMSGLDGLTTFSKFRSMSEQTYTSLMPSADLKSIDTSNDPIVLSKYAGEKGVVMTGAVVDMNPKVQIWNYYCPDILNTFYADAAYTHALTKELILTAEAQIYGVNDLGKYQEILKNIALNGSYQLYGAKASIQDKGTGLTYVAAYNQFSGNSKTVTAFGNWGGYPEYVAIPYMYAQDNGASSLANSRMGKVGITAALEKIGLNGQTLSVSRSLFDLDETVMRDSDIGLTTILYKYKVTKKLMARAQYEIRNSRNYRYDNDMLTLSLRYDY